MDQYDRPRPQIPLSSYPSAFLASPSQHRPPQPPHDPQHQDDMPQHEQPPPPAMRGAKRKRLAKACDACHKSKRRCDGTAPCSNCFFASKQCTYTDASGRPVPAPHRFEASRPGVLGPPASDSRALGYTNQPHPSQSIQQPDSSRYPHHPRVSYPSSSGPSTSTADVNDDERRNHRKRPRTERGDAIPPEDLIIDGPVTTITMDRPASVELDHGLTRELTNLFFTHCHPARAIIHKPTFAANLSHNRVPLYLLHAVCALAAPLSKQSRIRTNPSRFAGKPFAQEALSLMFDGAGRLVCEPNLAAAQALCLLQMHDILTKESNAVWGSRYHGDLALRIVEALGVHSPEHPTLTPVPSLEFISASLEREAIRRIFWYIHLIDVKASIYFKKPITFTAAELRLRLPVDETSFELGVHSTLPEYLHLPAVRTQYASEFGHLIRIITIYAKVELIMDEVNGPYQGQESVSNTSKALLEAEQQLEDWARTLPDQLRFSEESLDVQQSMFETSSNTGAWCWCCLHIYHAACALAINSARQRHQREPSFEPHWALSGIESILKMLGDRAKNSLLLGAALWPLIKYAKRDDPQVRAWCSDYEECFGTKMFELVQDWRPQPSPPQRHQYSQVQPSHSQQQQQLQRSGRNGNASSSFLGRPPPLHHGGDVSLNSIRSPPSPPHLYARQRYGDESASQPSSTSAPSARMPASHLPPPGASGSRGVASMGGDVNYSPIKTERESTALRNGTDPNPDGPSNGPASATVRTPGSDGSGPNSGPPSSRNSVTGESIGPSLPSLKDSGLLDWNTGGGRFADLQKKGRGVSRASPRRSPPLPPLYQSAEDSRSAVTLGMPVGLPWLANESR